MIGGEVMRTWISLAPAARMMCTIFLLVVPRTIESSTRTIRLSRRISRTGIQLHLHAKIADRLHRLDEGPPDVVIADQAELQRDAALPRISERGRHTRVRHRHHHIRIRRASRWQGICPAACRLSLTFRPKTRLSGRLK